MRTFKSVFLFITAGILLQSCEKGSMWGIRGEGENISEKRNVSGFNSLNLGLDANITYVQDSVYSVEVSGQKNILAVLNVKVEGGELKMDFKRNIWKHNTLGVVIHSPDLSRITLSGDGNINIKDKFVTSHLYLTLSGNGNITIPTLTVQSLHVALSGFGNVRIEEGACKSEDINVSGAGEIYTEFFVADNTTVNISGGTIVTVNTTSMLDVKISGNGEVRYRGNPVITSNISGSGNLLHID